MKTRLLFVRLLSFFRGARLDREMDEEMRLHIDLETDRNVANGMPLREARYAAMRSFGGMEQLKERERRERGLLWLENVCRDLRLSARSLSRTPGFTALALITLALGIGLNTSMFSVTNRMLLRPLPFEGADRLVRVFGTTQQSDSWSFAPRYLEDLIGGDGGQADYGVYAQWSATLTEPGRPAEYLMALRVSPDFLDTLGVKPFLGRGFREADDHPKADVVILPYSTWLRLYGGDREILGKSVRIDGEAMTVVGVLPESFAEASYLFGPVGILKPLGLSESERRNRTQRGFNLVGRLGPDTSLKSMESALQARASLIAEERALEHRDQSVRVMPLHASGLDEASRNLLLLVMGLAGSVLLIACANLASLQLVRAMSRARESAMRAALGASRLNLIRPLFAESLLLSVCGGGAGLLVAVFCNRWISAHAVVNSSIQIDFALDGRVLLFALIATIVTGLLFGAGPSWLTSQIRVNDTLKRQSRGMTGSRGQSRLRHFLVTGEVALVCLLLAGAGFFLTGITRFVNRDPGWNTRDLAHGAVALQSARYPGAAENIRFFKQLRDRLSELPEVEGVAVGWALPLRSYLSSRPITAQDMPERRDGGEEVSFFNAVFPGYFDTLQIPLLAGRDFSEFDDEDAPRVAIVNETLARSLWPNESALGKGLGSNDPENPNWMEVVGVVRDVGYATDLQSPSTRFQVYVPFVQEPWGYANVALRAKGQPADLINPMRSVVAELDPDVAVAETGTARGTIERSWANFSLIIELLAGFALLGLLLAAIGIYGVISETVARRMPEFGLRVTLGARLEEIRWMVLGVGARLAFTGVALGLAASFALGRLLRSAIPGLSAPQQLVLALVGVALTGVALFACWLPARRASKVEPALALRGD